MKRKIVHIAFNEPDWFIIHQEAKKEHLKVSTWIKRFILKALNSKESR